MTILPQLLLAGAVITLGFSSPTFVQADGPADNLPAQVRPIPPLGIPIPDADREFLEQHLERLQQLLTQLQAEPAESTQMLLPDVEIFHRAVRQALDYQEFYTPRDIANGRAQVEEGIRRAEALLKRNAPWTQQTGFVVRGYRSRIDQTVQPYGLEIPASYTTDGTERYRTDLWLHGRGEKATESVFIAQRMSQPSKYAPRETIVLHPFGRYCNAFKFAGEIDVLEALEHAKSQYRIDADLIAVRGFSMGGAGCWQLAVHYPDRFFAANPGAGFSETREFLNQFQKETVTPAWYEQKLWAMYDCPGYAANFFQLPLIAYSGEIDRQKQAADVMEKALAAEGLTMNHVIGPNTAHNVHPDSARLIDQQLEDLARTGRNRVPQEIRFTTYTLKYPHMHWLTLTGLEQHWEQARVHGKLRPDQHIIELDASGVTGLRLQFEPQDNPFPAGKSLQIRFPCCSNTSGQTLEGPEVRDGEIWQAEFHRDGDRWKSGPPAVTGLRKQTDLQGPIDDAFMDRFLIVKPTGTAWNPAVERWTNAEADRFVQEWRRQFRGDARVVNDSELTAEQIATHHLILFGDPSSHQYLNTILDRLPLQWTADRLSLGSQHWSATTTAPILIYPNPDNPQRYVVLNSGFTYREYAYLNNARQIPMLPDWAIVDLTTPPNAIHPGKIVDANFFDEHWQVRPEPEPREFETQKPIPKK